MKMTEGVEWAMHSCVNLSFLDDDRPVTAARLAAFYRLPTAYLNKQLQALARAGILTSTPGPRGGFRLARPPERISMLDVVTAIEGPEPAFRCAQILREGPGGDPGVDYRQTCVISQFMTKAELGWRRELAGRTVADIGATVAERFPAGVERTRRRLTE